MGTLRARDLTQATGFAARTIRYYAEIGLLPKPEGRGTGLLYREEHLVRLRAVRRLRAQRMPLDQIRARLSRMSHDEIVKLGAPPPPATPATPAPAATAPAPAESAGGPTQPTGPVPAGPAARPYPAEPWERISLLPGLELHVRADAGPLVRRLAAEIHARYSAAPPAGDAG